MPYTPFIACRFEYDVEATELREAAGRPVMATGGGGAWVLSLRNPGAVSESLQAAATVMTATTLGMNPAHQARIAIAWSEEEARAVSAEARPGEILVDRTTVEMLEPGAGGYLQLEQRTASCWEYVYDSRLSRLDGPFRRMFAAEIEEWVGPRRHAEGRRAVGFPGEPRVDNDLVGVALSGGGQRSGVFSLGVCQALARYGLLGQADYLSTVSGGGYLGASVQALCAEPVPYVDVVESSGKGRFGVEPRSFPYAFPRDPEPAPPPDLPIHGLESPALWHVRKHARLLGNRIGLLDTETWTTLYRYLGGMLFSWAVFLLPLPLLAAALGVWIWDEWFEAAIWPERAADGGGVEHYVRWWVAIVPPIVAVGVDAVLYLLAGDWLKRNTTNAWCRTFFLGVALAPLAWILYLALGGAVYLIVDASRGGTEFQSILGVTGAISTAATALGITRVTRAPDEGKRGFASQMVLLLGGYLLLAVLIVLLAWGMWWVFQIDWYWRPTVPVVDREPHVAILFAIVVLGAAATIVATLLLDNRRAARFLNWLSIHRVYRDRITRAWVVSANPAPNPGGQAASIHRWSTVWPRPELKVRDLVGATPTAPYPLICAAINIPGSRGDKLPERKGDSFVIAPVYTGSATTRWVPTGTRAFEYRKMPLGVAATISGAAFSPNMGEKSTRTFSILMTIFNARIGAWCDNPRTAHRRRRSALKLYYKELFANPSRDDHQVYLSDGGHFENLGLYELIRRRCRFVIAVTADTEKVGKHDRHGNLANAARMVREDFGVQIEMPNMVPLTRDKDGVILSSYAAGRILYPKARLDDGTPLWEEGTLIVIKTGLIPSKMSVDLLSHWRSHEDFPYTATLDQQFDQGQFEAYRQLGYLAGRAVGKAAGPPQAPVVQRFEAICKQFADDYPLGPAAP